MHRRRGRARANRRRARPQRACFRLAGVRRCGVAVPVAGPPGHRLEDESRRQLRRDRGRQRLHHVEPTAVLHELIEQPHPDAAIEQLGEIGRVAGAALHRVGGDAGRRDEVEELARDLPQLRANLSRAISASRVPARAPRHARVDRACLRAVRSTPRIGSRHGERTTIGDVRERTLRAQQEQRALCLRRSCRACRRKRPRYGRRRPSAKRRTRTARTPPSRRRRWTAGVADRGSAAFDNIMNHSF